MSNKQSNYPTAEATRELDGLDYTGEAIQSLMDLSSRGRPRTLSELRQRIDDYFNFCSRRNMRLGVEALSLSLGVSRVTFWEWCRRDNEWGETCREARQVLSAFIESAAMSGHLSPPIAIFALKNVANWKDTVSFEDVSAMNTIAEKQRTPTEIAAAHGIDVSGLEREELPVAEFAADEVG